MKTTSLLRTVLTTTLTVVAVVLALYLVYLLREPLGWIVIAAFLAIVLAGPVATLSRHMSRKRAILVTYLGVLLIPIALFLIVVPPLVREGADFVAELPEYADELNDYVASNDKLQDLDDQYGIVTKLQEEAGKLPARLGDAASWLGDLGVGLVNSAFALVTILILSVFIVANGRQWTDAALRFQEPARAAAIRSTMDRMADAVGAYVAGALFQAVVAGVTTFVVLVILGIPFAAPLAVITALFDLIPMVGATIAAVFVGVFTLFGDFPLDTIIWAIWAIVYQQLENNLIQPRIQNRAVGLHPFLVIVSVLLIGTLFGVVGAILAVPLTASLQIVIRDWWRRPEQAAAA